MEYLESRLIRQIDTAAVQELGMAGLLLMENAARGACDVLEAVKPQGRIIVVSGPGNNGGDGLAMARLLAANGIDSEVHLVRAGKSLTDDAQSNLEFLLRSGISVQEADTRILQSVLAVLTPSDWIVDALLGTGVRGTLRSPFLEIVEAINHSAAPVLSVDVPSGLDADSGEPCGAAVRAEVTVTFVATKTGFRFPHALPYLGRVVVRQIGVPQRWLNSWCETHTS